MNACLSLVKAFLASEVRNDLDWPRFLTLETSAFSAWIHFLNLAVFDLSGLYDFFVLALFHLNPPLEFPDHPALDFLLELLLRLFLAWR